MNTVYRIYRINKYRHTQMNTDIYTSKRSNFQKVTITTLSNANIKLLCKAQPDLTSYNYKSCIVISCFYLKDGLH